MRQRPKSSKQLFINSAYRKFNLNEFVLMMLRNSFLKMAFPPSPFKRKVFAFLEEREL